MKSRLQKRGGCGKIKEPAADTKKSRPEKRRASFRYKEEPASERKKSRFQRKCIHKAGFRKKARSRRKRAGFSIRL